MNNTPRTDAWTFDVVVKRGDAHLVREHYKDGSGDFVESDFVRQLERELNAANKTIRLQHELIATAEKRGVDKAKEELNAANERIKRLEEAGDRLAAFTPPSADRIAQWNKSKEAKP